MPSTDSLGRPLHDLRISITDRCNFRCVYCMPREMFGRDFAFLERSALLTFEEIAHVAQSFALLGVEKIRLTGGEPLIRRDVERLIEMLARVDGIHDITMTTNGSLLTRQKAQALKDAGLNRITISLDTLDEEEYRRINDAHIPLGRVLDAIDNANAVGFKPVKIDVVVMRGRNDTSFVEIARRFRGTGMIVRFIEYMDVGNTNGWRIDEVVSGAEIRDRIQAEWPLVAAKANYFGEVAQRWRYADDAGEIGIITSVTRPFCGSCTRARLSAEGVLYTCLFAGTGKDLRALLRGGASDDEVAAAIDATWRARTDRYSEIRSEATLALKKVEMSHIGG
ncbi:MAG TPA: GTP 3',8-cyclase MoaA [Thermoanaerobaculia bacterium]|nr:GTP 3',8-cyclase MoaA [Thermoanaerobaculia bacterium]